jgi:hypothetical protein
MRTFDQFRVYASSPRAADLYSETKNLCVCHKINGVWVRSKLIFVFKRGTAPHINNVELLGLAYRLKHLICRTWEGSKIMVRRRLLVSVRQTVKGGRG